MPLGRARVVAGFGRPLQRPGGEVGLASVLRRTSQVYGIGRNSGRNKARLRRDARQCGRSH